MKKRRTKRILMPGKKSNPVQIKAAGGIVHRPAGSTYDVLLIKRNGFWDLPKGKVEKGESVHICAIREVEEETGMQPTEISGFLCKTYHEYEQMNRYFGKTTYWFSMVCRDGSRQPTPQAEEGITDAAWVEVNRAGEMVHFDNLKHVISTFMLHPKGIIE